MSGTVSVMTSDAAQSADAGLQKQINDLAARVAKLEGGAVPPQPGTESPEGYTVPTNGPQIVDALGNVFTIMAARVGINGTADTATANVTQLYYHAHQMVHCNTAGNWYAATMSGPPPGSKATYAQVASPVPPPTGSVFTVTATGFVDGSGKAWGFRGLNCGPGEALNATQLFVQYPHLTALRITCNSGNTSEPATIDQVVQQFTAKGIVLEIEDHGGNAGNIAWYQQMATKYKNNPYVFLETPNEPGDASPQNNIIKAIRAAGFNGPVGIQPKGGYDMSTVAAGAAGQTNVFVTPHIYYSGTDPNGAQNYVNNQINASKNMGLWAVIDEFGCAMDGWNVDPYGASVTSSVIAAQQANRCGACFWAMNNGNHANGADSAFLKPDGSQLTPVGAGPIKQWLG